MGGSCRDAAPFRITTTHSEDRLASGQPPRQRQRTQAGVALVAHALPPTHATCCLARVSPLGASTLASHLSASRRASPSDATLAASCALHERL